jgi:hypothetical protein
LYYLRETSRDQHCIISGKHPVINIVLSPGNIQGSTLHYLREISSDQHCIISGKHPGINIVLSPGDIQGSTLYYLRETSRDQHCIISGKHPGINIVLMNRHYLSSISANYHCVFLLTSEHFGDINTG